FGYLESGKSLSRATLNRRLASLRRFVRMLVKEKYPVPQEVLEKLDDFEIGRDRRLPIALDRDEAVEFLDIVAKNPRDYAIILVMIYMGLRISEVVQLNDSDIQEGTPGISFRGKGGKERYVPVHPAVREAVLAYKKVRPEPEPDETGVPLFVSRWRRRIDPSTIRKFIKRYAQEAVSLDNRKRQKLSPHKFRHTFATLLLQGDVDIRYIQELLGHENLSTTEIYTRVHKADLEKAIDRHPLGMPRS
ncbi:MAG TPA: tyrosine-type recombinase/integrase, partial [Limnochordia bacterium]|nr:tyrosine-type recombinase/integrase [Limnochordia bacterium]